MDPESRLVARIVAGDADALAEVFAAQAQRVFNVAYGVTGSVSDAEDIVQDIFATLPERLAKFEGRSALSTWLHTVAIRAALLGIGTERQARRQLHEFLARRPRAELTRALDRVALERALHTLPGELRAVIWLKVVEGHTHVEIAEMLGIPANGSCKRLHQAKRLMREALGGER